MRTRTRGIQLTPQGERLINKQYKGQRIFARLGPVSQREAENWLRAEQDRIDAQRRQGAPRYFCDAAEKYLKECAWKQVRTLDTIGYHVTLVLPYLGTLPLQRIHGDSLRPFIEHRLEADGVSATSVNRTLEVIRTILNRAARVWRDEAGLPWLSSPPLIEMLREDPRPPRPLSWEEQRRLFAALPPHLQPMALFAVNTGLRDRNICHLRWDWEVAVPELGRSVFILPKEAFKSERDYVVILNDVAWSIVQARRGEHAQYVFTYLGHQESALRGPVDTMNNTAWQKARARAGLKGVRVHDLRHTFGQRLRQAGVASEDRALLLGHAVTDMTGHYATATVARLIDLANLANGTRDTVTLLRLAAR